jgi:hypothetical protein
MTCATCTNWKPRESGDMAKHHLAVCALWPRWKFYPPQATCAKHEPAPQEVVDGRRKWLGVGHEHRD